MRRPVRPRVRRALAAAGTLLLVAGATGCHGMRPVAGSTGPGKGHTLAPHDQQRAADRLISRIRPDAKLAARLPARVRDSGRLRMASSLGYPPMEMFDTDQKTPIGIDPSLGKAIGRVLGLRTSITNEDFNAQIPGVLTGRYDLAMSSMSDTPERRTKVTMVDYLQDGQAFVVSEGNPEHIRRPADVCGKKLAVVDNGSALAFAQQFSKDCKAKGRQPATILKFTGDQDAILQVREHRAAADINDYPVAAYRAATSGGKLAMVPIHGTEAPFGIATNPRQRALAGAIRDAVRKLIADGTYEGLLKVWNVRGMALRATDVDLRQGGRP